MRRTHALRSAAAAITVILSIGEAAPAASAAGSSSLAGTVFVDSNRNGVRDGGEAGIGGHGLYLFDSSGQLVGVTTTTSDGAYSFGGLTQGDHLLTSSYDSWAERRTDWVPTTTGTLRPEQVVHVGTGASTSDLGWREIVRSTTAGAPISAQTGPTGLRVESYNDAVSASELLQALAGGTLGAEGPEVTVRFDLGSSDITATSAGTDSSGRYNFFKANVYVTYSSWLSQGDVTLSHEYGHAWSMYHGYMTQQDPEMSTYLAARGLTGDPRLNTSHAWNVNELIAEDYRQLLGSSTARVAAQENADIPAASQVAGLESFLRSTFTTPAAATDDSPAATAPEIRDLLMNPTPVRSSGTASFSVNTSGVVSVEIRSSKGALIRTLASGQPVAAGSKSFTWDRRNERGRSVGKGTYSVVVMLVDASGFKVTATRSFNVA